MLSSLIIPLVLAATPLLVDRQAHRVTFTARATEVKPDTILEFAFVGPLSDRAYEAMFVTDAEITEIAQAFDAAGIPRGEPVNASRCRFWPAGKGITISPAISDFVRDKQSQSLPIVYTGGRRDEKGMPTAQTNMPAAVFALYNLDQSLLLLDDASDQSLSYGRYVSTDKAKSGERYTFTISWDGKTGTTPRKLVIESGKLSEAITSLKGASGSLDVQPVFTPELKVAEAKAAAMALSIIDSRTIKINGFAEGQFFYRGFLPDERWRDRSKRLSQPIEVSISSTNTVCTIIDEDWSVEGMDPRLTPHTESIETVGQKFKGDTCLFFTSHDVKLATIFALMKQLPKCIRNWYVYID